MMIDPQIGNFLFTLAIFTFAWLCSFAVYVWIVAPNMAKYCALTKKEMKVINKVVKLAFVLVYFVGVYSTFNSNAPKFTLQDSARSSQYSEDQRGEVRSLAPEQMKPEERLEYNRQLNEHNAIEDD